MVYKPNIPQPETLLSISQGDLLENFSQLNTVFGNNHIPFDNGTPAERGKHTNVILKTQGGNPGTLVDEGALFTKVSGAATELFYRYPAGGTVVPLTSALGVIKAWVIFTANAGTPCPIIQSYNVAAGGVTNPLMQEYQITYTTPLTLASPMVLISSARTAVGVLVTSCYGLNLNTGCRIYTSAIPITLSVMVIGA